MIKYMQRVARVILFATRRVDIAAKQNLLTAEDVTYETYCVVIAY